MAETVEVGGEESSVPTVNAGGPCEAGASVSTTVAVRNPDDKSRGEIATTNICVPGRGTITSIALRYTMDSFFGEPTRAAVFRYEADFEVSDAAWLAQVVTPGGEPIVVGGREVFVSWNEGPWPKPGGGYGWDTAGSPDWDNTFGHSTDGRRLDAMLSEEDARSIYRRGFSLANLRIVTVNDVPVP